MGKLNYYGKFLPAFASVCAPLNHLRCKDTPWKWSTECAVVFDRLKQMLADKTRLVHFDPEKEGLSIVYGIRKFNQYLSGRHFTILTDHKPLLTIFGPDKSLPVISLKRLQRWALLLMGYDYDIRYRSSAEHSTQMLFHDFQPVQMSHLTARRKSVQSHLKSCRSLQRLSTSFRSRRSLSGTAPRRMQSCRKF